MMIRKIGHKAAVVAAALVMVGGTSAAFTGTALATDHHRHVHGDGGSGGKGGDTNANCLVPLGVSAGILGQGSSNTQCTSTGGQGGDAGDGISH